MFARSQVQPPILLVLLLVSAELVENEIPTHGVNRRGQPITIVIPQDRLDEERVILTRIRRGGRIDHFETVRQRKDGSLIVVSLTVSPIKNGEGKIIGASRVQGISQNKSSLRSRSPH